MISDFKTGFIYLSDILMSDKRYTDTCVEIIDVLKFHNIGFEFLQKTNDIWARDYMPIQLSDNEFVEFRYDPDYLQGYQTGYRNLKTYPDIVFDQFMQKAIKSNLIIDGGNIVKHDDCIIMTDKVIYENRHKYTKNQLIKELYKFFQISQIVIIPHDVKDPYGHSDGMVRFIDSKTVLLNSAYGLNSEVCKILKSNKLNCEFLDYKVVKKNSRNWCYLNFLQTKDIILIPKLNIDEDNEALEQIKIYYPDYALNSRVIQVMAAQIVKRGGALNCISWTTKRKLETKINNFQ
jgi:agmatine/peptidylarginine deiminase